MQNNSDKNEDYFDVNDAFDSIAFAEESVSLSAFTEGLEKGKADGELEGYHLGYHRGAELGCEIGFYKGFIVALNKTESSLTLEPQHIVIIEKLSNLLESFPKVNDTSNNIIELRDRIRSNYKRLCSLLKLEMRVPEGSRLSF